MEGRTARASAPAQLTSKPVDKRMRCMNNQPVHPVYSSTYQLKNGTDTRFVRPYIAQSMQLVHPPTYQLSTELIINDLNLTFQTHPFCAPIWVRLACKMAHITAQNR